MDQKVSQEALGKAKLNQEAAVIPWKDLQKHFARGVVYFVDSSLDLIDVGYQLSVDNRSQVEQWLGCDMFQRASDEQARQWYEQDASVWALVVQPWVLVQNK